MLRRGSPFVWGLVVMAAVILLPVAAYGAYSVFGSASGNAAAATLPAPGKPTVAAAPTLVWPSVGPRRN